MVKGKIIGKGIEKPSLNYRKLDALNQSMIALFDEKPVQFFRQYKMGEQKDVTESTAFAIGDMVDFFILECQGDEEEFQNRFDEKFVLSDSKGSGQVFDLADILFKITVRDMDENGQVQSSFVTRFEAAYSEITALGKYKEKKSTTGFKSLDVVMDDFNDKAKDYFQTKLDNIGRTVVNESLVDKAKKVANGLLNDSFTKSMFIEQENEEIFTHFPIEWNYDLDDDRYIECKSELDMIKVNHKTKTIQVVDLKTTFDNEMFERSYIKNYYYLQNAFYTMAAEKWAKDNLMEDYTVLPVQFVVGDTSSNNRRPLIYITSPDDYEKGVRGFSLNGYRCRGIAELISEIAWCEEKGIWNCSRESYENNGKLNLRIKYD